MIARELAKYARIVKAVRREGRLARPTMEAMMKRWLACICGGARSLPPLPRPRVGHRPYPTKPIRIVVPFPRGGTTDVLARAARAEAERIAAASLSVVDNRPGAGGNIGAELVAKSPPDGYTLLMGTVGTHAINPSLYPKMPYDHVRDFAPVILVAGVPNVLVVNPSLPVNSVQGAHRLRARPIRASSTSRRRATERRSTCPANSSRR